MLHLMPSEDFVTIGNPSGESGVHAGLDAEYSNVRLSGCDCLAPSNVPGGSPRLIKIAGPSFMKSRSQVMRALTGPIVLFVLPATKNTQSPLPVRNPPYVFVVILRFSSAPNPNAGGHALQGVHVGQE